ncbi:hypothetical protein AOXY_G37431 [Acipenser oxyrinchus oxyrinchus]|uniref:Uncharacterized protein n=1 Tax=Acipenser oxyrinchus oxyrinchus TaxID=40147 RepID=A0AAD8CDV1_ACIOX|nr:hypothetical protein AOXY_G37431 [Acipenser oxyrinchus oxyrinchus]
MPTVLTVFFTLVFELVGMFFDLPAHTTRCKGKPYNRSDAYFGLCIALGVALLNLDTNYVYTLSYGSGIMAFAVRGAQQKYNSLWFIKM